MITGELHTAEGAEERRDSAWQYSGMVTAELHREVDVAAERAYDEAKATPRSEGREVRNERAGKTALESAATG